MDRDSLINMYNGTSTDDGTGEIETYENWLERQLLDRINFISINDYLPEVNKIVLVRTPFNKYPYCIGYWNGTNWIDTTDKTIIENVGLWRSLK
jgi:hypothetical protein